MKTIYWVTADYFIEVDSQVVPLLSTKYKIKWIFILPNKNSRFSDEEIKNLCEKISIEYQVVTLKYWARNPLIIKQYLNLVMSRQFRSSHVIYINYNGFPYFIPILRLFTNRKEVIIASHNSRIPKGARNEFFAKVQQKLVLTLFRNFHVFSKNQLHWMRERVPRKNIFYAPLALYDFGHSKKVPPKNLIIFLFFGVIATYKRLDILIKAACNVYEKTGKKFKVHIAGSCKNWEIYQSLIRYPDIFNLDVRFIKNSEVADIFCGVHYLVQPYQDSTQSGPLKIAYNYNIPVVASNIPAFREYIEDNHNGYLFAANSVESLENTLLQIIEGKHKKYPLIKENLTDYTKSELSIETIVSRYEDFFNSCDL